MEHSKSTKKTIVWIEDGLPPKAVGAGDTPWQFVTAPDPVFSGKSSSVRQAKGRSQHYFTGADPPLVIEPGMTLFAHVYLDPRNPPAQIMLQFNDGSWEHRAFWGKDLIDWGTGNTSSRHHVGDLPEAGRWIRLEVDPAAVGLKPGAKLNGWAFTQVDGKVFWDQSGGRVDTNPASDPAFSWAAWKSLPENDRNSNLPGALREIVQGKDPAQWPESARRGVFHHWLGHIYAGEIAGLEPLKAERAAIMKEREDITKLSLIHI